MVLNLLSGVTGPEDLRLIIMHTGSLLIIIATGSLLMIIATGSLPIIIATGSLLTF